MNSKNDHVDPDDFFADTKMSFGDHIEDLRTHLVRAIKGFLIALVGSFFLAQYVLAFIRAPVERQLITYWERHHIRTEEKLRTQDPTLSRASPVMILLVEKRALRRALDMVPAEEGPILNPISAFQKLFDDLGVSELVDARKYAESAGFAELPYRNSDPLQSANHMHRYLKQIQPPALTTLSITEAFAVWVKVSLLTGFVIGSPWIFYQIWMFVAAGLYPHEKKYVNIYLPFSLILFLGGVLLCEFFVMDKAIEALLWFNEYLGMAPDLRLSEWLGFAIFMPLVFGLSFQTPLVMLFIQRVGVVTIDGFRHHRRMIWFLMAVFAAVITPSTDPVSMMLLWLPMTLLFELGIWLCTFLPGQPLLEFDVPEPEEMVEV